MKRELVGACVVLLTQAFPSHAADPIRGKQLYESRCGACHSIDDNRAGPAHKGVFGRKAASAPGFDYSPALRASRVVWNEKTLNRWLADPEKLVPGQKMGFTVPEAKDRADVIEFLRRSAH
jgi:cytochrome c